MRREREREKERESVKAAGEDTATKGKKGRTHVLLKKTVGVSSVSWLLVSENLSSFHLPLAQN